MLSLLEQFTAIPAVSGSEGPLREAIIGCVKDHAEYQTDALGNLIVYKKGEHPAPCKLLLDAHMDEVGLVITYINSDGTLHFSTAGGIDPRVLMGCRVQLASGAFGVIALKPVHLLDEEQRKIAPKHSDLTIDIGAKSKEDAQKVVSIGDTAFFDSQLVRFGDGLIKARALDDRIGCALLVDMIRSPQPYDLYFSFSTQEELGCRGAKVAAYRVQPAYAIVVEGTTAADTAGVKKEKQVCRLGEGPVISFMDGGTVYDQALYHAAFDTAKKLGLPCQPKAAVSGGNNASAIHLTGPGVRVLSISAPCRYIHSPVSVVKETDLWHMHKLTQAMAEQIAGGMHQI